MGNNHKTGDETRATKSKSNNINDNSDIALQAEKQAAEQLAARAEAVGLDEDATMAEVVDAETKAAKEAHEAELDRQKKLKEENPKLWAMQNTINQMFAERDKTNLAKLTEAEVRTVLGKTGVSVDLNFHFSNEEQTSGYITVKEFKTEVRCPLEGEFEFGIDYVALGKTKAAELASAKGEDAKKA
jgi:hypothetical protein